MVDDWWPLLSACERKVLWLASWTIHHANHLRDNVDGLKVGGHQASSASVAAIMTALYFHTLRPADRVAVKPHAAPIYHAIQYLLGRQTPREAGRLPRLQRGAILSVAHQGQRRRRFLDRFGGLGRGADAVFLAGAGLCPRAWLGPRSPGRPHDRAPRRRRARRRQHLRGAARGLEAGRSQLLVDRRLQPAKPRRGGARRAVGALRKSIPQFRLGRGGAQIRLAAAGRFRRAGRRGAAALDRSLSEPALLGAGIPGRRRLAQAPDRRDRRSGTRFPADRFPQRRRTGAVDGQSRRSRSARHHRGFRRDRSRPAGLFHRLHDQGLRPAVRRPQGQSFRPDDARPDGNLPRGHEHPPRPRMGRVRGLARTA